MPAQEIIPSGIALDATSQAVTDLLKEVAIRLAEIADSICMLTPDNAGRLRVAAETLGTLSTITTVTTVSTVTNQAQIGGIAANQQMIALTLGSEADIRRNIVIS